MLVVLGSHLSRPLVASTRRVFASEGVGFVLQYPSQQSRFGAIAMAAPRIVVSSEAGEWSWSLIDRYGDVIAQGRADDEVDAVSRAWREQGERTPTQSHEASA